jgi:hypothetical protein
MKAALAMKCETGSSNSYPQYLNFVYQASALRPWRPSRAPVYALQKCKGAEGFSLGCNRGNFQT